MSLLELLLILNILKKIHLLQHVVQGLPESKALKNFVSFLAPLRVIGLRAPDAYQGEVGGMTMLLNQAPQEASEQLVIFMAPQSSCWPRLASDLTRPQEKQGLLTSSEKPSVNNQKTSH